MVALSTSVCNLPVGSVLVNYIYAIYYNTDTERTATTTSISSKVSDLSIINVRHRHFSSNVSASGVIVSVTSSGSVSSRTVSNNGTHSFKCQDIVTLDRIGSRDE